MSTVVGPRHKAIVTFVGVLTLLAGAAYAVLGGTLAFAGGHAVADLRDDDAGGMGFLLRFVAGLVTAVGVALLVQGALGVLGGLGVLLRKPWGRAVALVVAVLA